MFPPSVDTLIVTLHDANAVCPIMETHRDINGDSCSSTDAQAHYNFGFFLCFRNRGSCVSCCPRFFLRCYHFCFQNKPPCFYNIVTKTKASITSPSVLLVMLPNYLLAPIATIHIAALANAVIILPRDLHLDTAQRSVRSTSLLFGNLFKEPQTDYKSARTTRPMLRRCG